MPVVFFVDPKILKDEDTKDIDEITLSYTFYPVETAALPPARAARTRRGKLNEWPRRRITNIHLVEPDPWPIIGAISALRLVRRRW